MGLRRWGLGRKAKPSIKLSNWAVLLLLTLATFVLAAQATTAKRLRTVYIGPDLSLIFSVVLAGNFQQTARELGFDVVLKSADNDAKRDADEWDRAIATGYDAIVGGAVDSDAIVSSVKKANAAGIPVFMLGRLSAAGKVVVSTRADNWSLGSICAEETVRRLTEKYGEPRGLVLEICGVRTVNGRIRHAAMDSVFKKYPKIKVIFKITRWLEREFFEFTRDVATANPDLDAIALGTDAIPGVDAALRSLGKLKKIGEKGHIITVGIDGDPRVLELIRKDLWDASALQDIIPYSSALAYYMKDYFDGKLSTTVSQLTMKDYDLKDNRFRLMEGRISNPGGIDDGWLVRWNYNPEIREPEGMQVLVPSRLIDKSNVDDPSYWGNMEGVFEF